MHAPSLRLEDNLLRHHLSFVTRSLTDLGITPLLYSTDIISVCHHTMLLRWVLQIKSLYWLSHLYSHRTLTLQNITHSSKILNLQIIIQNSYSCRHMKYFKNNTTWSCFILWWILLSLFTNKHVHNETVYFEEIINCHPQIVFFSSNWSHKIGTHLILDMQSSFVLTVSLFSVGIIRVNICVVILGYSLADCYKTSSLLLAPVSVWPW